MWSVQSCIELLGAFELSQRRCQINGYDLPGDWIRYGKEISALQIGL